MARQFTREEFYKLVWSKPLTHLAKEFVLSNVALHKICRKHDIPNPPLGWWAKKAAGQKVKQTPLPRAKAGVATLITIIGGELRQEPDAIVLARENARVLASSMTADVVPNPIVARTVARLYNAKPAGVAGLVAIDGVGLIKCEVAPASIDRFELALNRIAAAAKAIGIELVRGNAAAAFLCDGEAIGFAVTEAVKRENHVATDQERADQEAWQRKQARRLQQNSWDDVDFSLSGPRIPEWDYHPTGQLAVELEQAYFCGGTPRRSFRDAKIQRLEVMASDIAVGVAVFAAAKKQDRLRREEEARHQERERLRREQVLRDQHVEERRGSALDKILDEIATLERLRCLVASLRTELPTTDNERVATFVAFAEQRLSLREGALSAGGLARLFDEDRLFGSDDDHGFRLPRY
jgi:hypothetical protein